MSTLTKCGELSRRNPTSLRQNTTKLHRPSDEKPNVAATTIKPYDTSRRQDARVAKLVVTWKQLSVYEVEEGVQIYENVLSQFNYPRISEEAKQKKASVKHKTILDDTYGCR